MNLIQSIQQFVRDEEGISTVEYAFVLAFVGLVAGAAIKGVGTNIESVIDTLADNVSSAFTTN
jgi:Flp pilus assembly pilin Flp